MTLTYIIYIGAWGCLCLREVCVSPLKLSTQQSKCPKCELTSGCTFPDICVPGLRICWSCFETFKKEVSAGCIKSNNTVTIPGTNIDLPVCVSTQWILERGLQHAVLRDSGAQMQPVLCIPDNNGDIPCGTPGHLLRDANTRKLVSYQTLCDKRRDCISTSMPVSQLSHNYDWSRYRTENYELTSLSAHPHAKTQYSPSRILAGIADMLNRAGMGRMCDLIYPVNP